MLFLTNGAIFANLLPRYPEIKAGLGLSNIAFGVAVAAFALGALLAGLTAGALVRRYGSSRVAIGGTVMSAAGILVAGAAPVWFVLAGALFVAGAMDSITDVAQNSHGLRVQRLYKRSILNSFHALWSVGAVLGGIIGALAAQLEIPVAMQLAGSAVLFGVIAVVAKPLLLPGVEPDDREPAVDSGITAQNLRWRPRLFVQFGALVGLVVIAASGAVVEDAGSSWSAIYISDSLQSSAFIAGIGFIAFQAMQFLGRIFGDGLVDRFGQRMVARTGGVVVFVGMGVALAFPSVPGTIVGFGLAGLGVATLIPAAMHAADELQGFKPGTGLTIVSWLLRVGFLLSPLVVGAVADVSSLRFGLLVVPAAAVLVVIFASVLTGRVARTVPLD
ncbi:MFS transporter [Cryobacterium adonitolivorans]|nr:MFS transporter [Cryobacterium adonitolivorans]